MRLQISTDQPLMLLAGVPYRHENSLSATSASLVSIYGLDRAIQGTKRAATRPASDTSRRRT